MLDVLKTFYKGAGNLERGFWPLFCMLYRNELLLFTDADQAAHSGTFTAAVNSNNGFTADRGKNLTNLCIFTIIKSIN